MASPKKHMSQLELSSLLVSTQNGTATLEDSLTFFYEDKNNLNI